MEDTDRYLLKKSFRILKRNYGCPGNDSISIKEIKKNYNYYEYDILESLKTNAYKFEKKPKLVTINTKLKQNFKFFVYNVVERWIQQYIKLQIEPIIDPILSKYVYAYRRGKKDIDSYKYILKTRPNFILRVDIKNYFSFIDREKLFDILNELKVENNLLDIIKKSFEHCEKGLPPGHVLSCMLSNLSLNEFDSKFPENYVRYSDEMMFACQTRSETYETLCTVKKLLKVYGFCLNQKKTKIINNPILENLSWIYET